MENLEKKICSYAYHLWVRKCQTLNKKKKNAVSLANQCKQEYDEQWWYTIPNRSTLLNLIYKVLWIRTLFKTYSFYIKQGHATCTEHYWVAKT